MKSLALGWCSLRAALRRGFCGGVGRRWGVGGALGLVCVVGRAEPVVSNVTSSQIAGSREVAITYTLADATALDGRFNVTVQASRDNGATWAPVTQVTGAVSDVAPGSGKQITWKAGVEWPGLLLPQAKVRLIADDGMALIPAGTFTMGSVVASIVGTDKSDGLSDATHAVTLSAFYLAKTEATYADWVAVRTWARDAARGAGVYDFGATLGEGKGDTHPVHTVSWYDVVKWCNAKSERAGLTPVYYTNEAQTLVYRTGNADVTAAQVKWGANGYRLPTEAEWEYAARGGMSGQRFPWGDTITHVQANYNSTTSYAYDVSTTRGLHPTYATGASPYPYTSPVGVFAANGYGLSDMVGNVWEWTWDVYGSYGSGAVTDPRGAASGSDRVIRGGSWFNEASLARSASRYDYGNPDDRFFAFGFRLARSSVP
jgi:formylglycine-generating enzyme required for sulfatase activity